MFWVDFEHFLGVFCDLKISNWRIELKTTPNLLLKVYYDRKGHVGSFGLEVEVVVEVEV